MVAMYPLLTEFLGVLLFVVVLIPVFAILWWLLMRKIDREGAEAGGSSGRQFLSGKERTYAATITIPGRAPEQVTVPYYSRGEAKRALRSMYGKRNVSDLHLVEPKREPSRSA